MTGSGFDDGTDGSSPLEARVAKLEASVEHIAVDIADIKDELKTLRGNARTDFRLVFGALISVALGQAAIMAKGFHWI